MGVNTEIKEVAQFGCEFCEHCNNMCLHSIVKVSIDATLFALPLTPKMGAVYRFMCLECQQVSKPIKPKSRVEEALTLAKTLPPHNEIQAGVTAIGKYVDRITAQNPGADSYSVLAQATMRALEPFDPKAASYITKIYLRGLKCQVGKEALENLSRG